jgi:ribonuclease R
MNRLEPLILDLLARKDYLPANVPELLRALALAPAQQQELQRALRDLEHAGGVARIKGNRYIIPSEADLIPGRIRMNRSGKGFLQPDDGNLKEIAIPLDATGTALHEDRVLVRRDVRPPGLRHDAVVAATGTVVRILERRRTRIVGTLQRGRQFLYVIPDDPRIPHDIFVPEPKDVGRPARVGDKVVAELQKWESRNSSPEGEIIEVLGAPDEEGVDMLSVLRQYDLPLHFPKLALNEARAIGSVVLPQDTVGRVDCRRHQVVTIDPDDAKDFDDAICLERVSAEQWRLWVHIADVSHYVKPGSALDVEARKRGNSTYLVDRVIPMLPEALSNELCSLKPNVDRLTKCVEFLVSNEGRVLSTKFYSAVIHSQRRYTYGEVLAVLQRQPAGPIEEMLRDAHELAQRIRKLRFQAGSLALDFPEMKIRLDEQGKIRLIERMENDVSHQLIEEYMLLANEAVATRLMAQRQPAVYRVHEVPDERRLAEYREDVLGHKVPCGNLSHPGEVQKLLHRLDALPIGPALKIGFLRSLMRARYAVEPLGHYGLAKKRYTHFTSPIRRYADLVVHRALFDKVQASAAQLKETADHISTTERNSADAERDSKDVKLYAFLKAQLASGKPERYPALVTDVRNFGFFVDVPGLAMSGLVPLSTVTDDFYVFEPDRNHLVGRRTRRIIRLGDRLTVQVAKVDSFKKQVDFRLAQEAGQKLRPASSTRHPLPMGSRPPERQRPARPEQRERGQQRGPGQPGQRRPQGQRGPQGQQQGPRPPQGQRGPQGQQGPRPPQGQRGQQSQPGHRRPQSSASSSPQGQGQPGQSRQQDQRGPQPPRNSGGGSRRRHRGGR